jgi:hypothetical protein
MSYKLKLDPENLTMQNRIVWLVVLLFLVFYLQAIIPSFLLASHN